MKRDALTKDESRKLRREYEDVDDMKAKDMPGICTKMGVRASLTT